MELNGRPWSFVGGGVEIGDEVACAVGGCDGVAAVKVVECAVGEVERSGVQSDGRWLCGADFCAGVDEEAVAESHPWVGSAFDANLQRAALELDLVELAAV